METGLTGLDEVVAGAYPGLDDGVAGGPAAAILAALANPRPDRVLLIAQAYREGLSTADIHAACKYDPWFLDRIAELVAVERDVRANGLPETAPGMLALKKLGFADARLGALSGLTPDKVAERRRSLGIRPVFKRVDTCAAEFPSRTPYMYSAYQGEGFDAPECEAEPSDRDKVVILGGGPNRIGQGIEFDYCCVHAALRAQRGGPGNNHGQLQPRDRVDRLRHLRPTLLRAPDRRGRGRADRRRGASWPPSGRDRPVRRPDAAQAGLGACRRGDSGSSAPRRTPSTWPRTASGSRPF